MHVLFVKTTCETFSKLLGNRGFAGFASQRLAVCAAMIVCGLVAGCRTPGTTRDGNHRTFQQKLPAPREFAQGSSSLQPGPFEQQFRLDTRETNTTRRAEMDQHLRVKGQSKDALLLKFDLSRWPETLRPLARAWLGIGATNTFTTEVNINLNFSQNGTGVNVPLNNRISINNIALMGCDFLVKDGNVTVEIENAGLPRDVDYTLHAIIYVPRKADPNCSR